MFAHTMHGLGTIGRERFQVDDAALVSAVLRPHNGEDAKLGDVRRASEELHDTLVLVARQPMALEDGTIDHRMAIAVTTDSKMRRPSTPPSSGSHARSGCGIMPTTFRDSLQTDAIALAEPLGFHASASRPSGSV